MQTIVSRPLSGPSAIARLRRTLIGETVARLKDGSIVNYRYDRDSGTLAPVVARDG